MYESTLYNPPRYYVLVYILYFNLYGVLLYHLGITPLHHRGTTVSTGYYTLTPLGYYCTTWVLHPLHHQGHSDQDRRRKIISRPRRKSQEVR